MPSIPPPPNLPSTSFVEVQGFFKDDLYWICAQTNSARCFVTKKAKVGDEERVMKLLIDMTNLYTVT